MGRQLSKRGIMVLGLLIGVVAAVVCAPALERSRDSIENSRCLANLRKLNRALLMYCEDHDQRLPLAANKYNQAEDPYTAISWGGWGNAYDFEVLNHADCIAPDPAEGLYAGREPGVLSAYLRDAKVWRCPADRGAPGARDRGGVDPAVHPSFAAVYGSSYCFHLWFDLGLFTIAHHVAWSEVHPMTFFDGGRCPFDFSDISEDATGDFCTMRDFSRVPHHPESWHKRFLPRPCPRREFAGQINVAFADGRAESLPCESKRVIPVRDRKVRSWTDAWAKSRWRTSPPL